MCCACTVPHPSCIGTVWTCCPRSTPHGLTWGSGASQGTDPCRSTRVRRRQDHRVRTNYAYPLYALHGMGEAIQLSSTSMESCLQEPASHCILFYSSMPFNAYLVHPSFLRDERPTLHTRLRRSYSRALAIRSRLNRLSFKRVSCWRHPARTRPRTTQMHPFWTFLIPMPLH